jgi:hypothetical protein
MACRLFERALDRGLTVRIAAVGAQPPMATDATLKDKGYSTREREPRPIYCAAPGSPFAAGRILAPSRAATAQESMARETKKPLYPTYGPGAFLLWHINAYIRSYYQYDCPSGEGVARCSTG